MKIILTEDIPRLGKAGEVVRVADGYARNYLLPRKMAITNFKGNLLKAEDIRKQADVKRAAQLEALRKLAASVNGVVLTFVRKTDESGKLFGSVTENDIALALTEKNLDVHKAALRMEKHFKEVGAYDVSVHLGMDIDAGIRVIVESENKPVEPAPAPVAAPVAEEPETDLADYDKYDNQ